MTVQADGDREATRALRQIPNIGPAMAQDLVRLGVRSVADLAQRDADELYTTLGQLDGRRHDPCVLDTFNAAVAYARGGPPRPWWEFSRERLAREGQPP